MLTNPLTPPERRKAIGIVSAADQALADRLEAELAGDADPFVEALQGALNRQTESVTTGLADVRNEIRSMRNWTTGLIAIAMVLQTVLVGGSVIWKGLGVTLSTSASAAQPATAVDLLEVSGPSPAPTDPPI